MKYFIQSDQPNQNHKIHLSVPHYEGHSLGMANMKNPKVTNSGSERHFEKYFLKGY